MTFRSDKQRRAAMARMRGAGPGKGRRRRVAARPRRPRVASGPKPQVMTALLKRHEGLVKSLAHRYAKQFPHADYNDLVQEGNLGLWDALKRFKEKRGFRLSTFATPHVEGRIRRAALASHPVRIPERRVYRELKAGKRLSQRLTVMGEDAERKFAAPDVTKESALVSEGGIGRAHARALTERLLAKLPTLERRVLRARWLNGELTTTEAAKRFKRSRGSINAIEKRAMAMLRASSMEKRTKR